MHEEPSTESARRSNSSPQIDELQWGRLRDWAELVRLPNVFTVLSNSLAAVFLVWQGWPPVISLLLVLTASVFAYWGGMILNDVADLEEDRASGRRRPLVRESVSPVIAGHIGNSMLLVGPLLVLLAIYMQKFQPIWMGAAFASAVGLSLCIRTYDSSFKHTPVGPVLMGGCRALNVLMVGSAMLAISEQTVYPRSILLIALGLGIYVLGITVFARREESQSSQAGLVMGIVFELVGISLIGIMPWWSDPNGKWTMDITSHYPILIALIAVTVLNRGVMAVTHPVPRKVQLAVKHAILTIVLLDASIVAVSAGPWFGGGVALLLLPAMVLGSRFRST